MKTIRTGHDPQGTMGEAQIMGIIPKNKKRYSFYKAAQGHKASKSRELDGKEENLKGSLPNRSGTM